MHGKATNTEEYLKDLAEWQQENLKLFRQLVHKASPDITEEIKWSVPVFMLNGKILFAMASFKAHTKYNFMANGASLDDVHQLFNNAFESKKSRSVDLREGQSVDQAALEGLIQQAIAKI